MKLSDIKSDIEAIFSTTVSDCDKEIYGKDFYEWEFDDVNYVLATLGASGRNRSFAQMQRGRQPLIHAALEKCRVQENKFFIIVPDSTNFSCTDYYIFVELIQKNTSNSSSFELKVPEGPVRDKIIRRGKKDGGRLSYFVTYVPAKDASGAPRTDLLEQYLLCYDTRALARYITKIIDFIPVPIKTEENIKKMSKLLWPQNFLISGAPGTGKSHSINKAVEQALKKEIFYVDLKHDQSDEYDEDEVNIFLEDKAGEADISVNEFVESLKREYAKRVTFHEDMTYESFIGCYKPVPDKKNDEYKLVVNDIASSSKQYNIEGSVSGETISYKFEAGPFINVLVDSIIDPDRVHFLIIEEINRARTAAVFGDMFQLLDRKAGVSEYYITPEASLDTYLREVLGEKYDGTLRLPANMYIWATMNNADQGVNPLDSAFKRRWAYLYLDVESSEKDGTITIGNGKNVRWNIFRSFLNEKILNIATEDKCIGAWYFSDIEMEQISEYYNAPVEERATMLNPLADKLLVYLLNDICRMDPSALFKSGYANMPSIRSGMKSGICLEDILNIDWTKIYAADKEWIEKNNELVNSSAESAAEIEKSDGNNEA